MDVRNDLEGWLNSVAHRDNEWLPLHEELAFGLNIPKPSKDPVSKEEDVVILDGIKLMGSIDLVEKNTETGLLRVTDYKSGRKPTELPVHIGGGRVLQPVLYALAAEQILGQRALSGQLFYATRRESYERVEIVLDSRARNAATEALAIIHDSIRDGFLPAAPADGACSKCDYRALCGPYENERLQLKPRNALRDLERLRKIP